MPYFQKKLAMFHSGLENSSIYQLKYVEISAGTLFRHYTHHYFKTGCT